MSKLIIMGTLLIFLGFILIFISSFTTKDSNIKAAGGIFIGPFPIFGAFTDKKMFYTLIILAILFFIFWLILTRFK